MEAVKHDAKWDLAFPITQTEADADGLDLANADNVVWRDWPHQEGYIVNATGQVVRVISTVDATPGHNIFLSIDQMLQQKAEQLLADWAGAAVAVLEGAHALATVYLVGGE